MARGTFRSAGRNRRGLRHSSSAIIEVNKIEPSKGEINTRLSSTVATIRIGADSLRSRSRESSGGLMRINRGIRKRRTFTHRMTFG